MRRRNAPRTLLLPLLTALAGALVLGACSGGASEDSSSGAGLSYDDQLAEQEGADGGSGAAPEEAPSADTGTDAAGTDDVGDAAAAERDAVAGAASAADRRVRRAEITFEVGDLTAAADRVRSVAVDLGGYVSDQSIGLRTVPEPLDDEDPDGPGASQVGARVPGEGRLVLRVPEPRLEEALASLTVVGAELNRWSTEEVVETAIVDLDSRVATQTRSVERVRALLAEATALDDILTLEAEVARRESDLEALAARRAALADDAALATVTVVLQTADVVGVPPEPEPDGFLAGLDAGWSALSGSTVVLLTIVGALLPFALLAAALGVPAVVLLRRQRTRSGAATG